MENEAPAVEPVNRLEDASAPGDDAVLELRGGVRCRLGGDDPRLPVWRRMAQGSLATGMPVYVESGSDGRAVAVLPVAARLVEEIGTPDEHDRVPVALVAATGEHFLDARHPHYLELRSQLEGARRDERPLLLAIDPRTLEILDARRPPPGLDYVVI